MITIGNLNESEFERASALVARVFDRFVAPEMSVEGDAEFKRYVVPEEFEKRRKSNCLQLAAYDGDTPVAVLEIRNLSHLSLFFVDAQYQNAGLGRRLLGRALQIIARDKPGLESLTVNAGPNSIEIYRRLGFVETEELKTVNGITHQPMKLNLGEK